MANHSILRITRELSEIQKGSDLSISVACKETDVRHVRALIIGPPDTPYEFGFFEFNVRFPKDYPTAAPQVNAITTNGGRCRFNPNIYGCGKVCLTWRGERGEEWSSAQGLESILISIQSLMSSNPYENEPGFENAKGEEDKRLQAEYVAKIRHETLRISVIQKLEEYLKIKPDFGKNVPQVFEYDAEADYQNMTGDAPFEPFKDLCKRRFLWYYDSYMKTIDQASSKVKEGQKFEQMPFEHHNNDMKGDFRYPELKRRMEAIRTALDVETAKWAEEGMTQARQETGLAASLQRQFEQIVEHYRNDDSVNLDLELVENNPFVWQMGIFGRPMTNLDGGLFKLRIAFSPRFPEEQPRVKFETDLFHHRISDGGVLCYFPKRSDDVKAHIAAIISAVEEESPAYDPRTLVNPEASKLFWGSPEDKKMYSRRLRRSVQRSMEE